MNHDIKISIILPVYNVEPYLRECLDSLVNQTLKEIEIICVDDGSTDESYAILEEYASKDARFILRKQENKGAGVARNVGLALATGEYISVLDSDDFFELTMMEELYQRAVATEAEVVVCHAKYYHNDIKEYTMCSGTYSRGFYPPKEVFSWKDLDCLITNVFNFPAWNKMVSRNFLEKYQIKFQEMYGFDDMYYSFFVLLLAERISALNRNLIIHRTGLTTNQMSTLDSYPFEFTKVMTGIHAEIEKRNLTELLPFFYQMITGLSCQAFTRLKKLSNFEKVYSHIQNVVEPTYKILELDQPPTNIAQYREIIETPWEEYLFKKWKGISNHVERIESSPLRSLVKPYFCFGAGLEGLRLLIYCQKHGFAEPLAFCDNNPKRQGEFLDTVPILSFEDALLQYPDAHIMISNFRYQEEILAQVLEKVPQERVSLLEPY